MSLFYFSKTVCLKKQVMRQWKEPKSLLYSTLFEKSNCNEIIFKQMHCNSRNNLVFISMKLYSILYFPQTLYVTKTRFLRTVIADNCAEECFKMSGIVIRSSEGHSVCWMTRTLEALQDEVVNVEVSGKEMVEGEWMSA